MSGICPKVNSALTPSRCIAPTREMSSCFVLTAAMALMVDASGSVPRFSMTVSSMQAA